jgi:hypothetical protein
MKHFNNYADRRFNGQCVYCGATPETREHVPPKVFLDRPYPENIPIVEACAKCNNGFSMDEEYMASLLDCTISGTVDPDLIHRENIKRTLKKQPALALRLQNAMKMNDDGIVFSVEFERINNVAHKIAVGHVLFELNLLLSETPKVAVAPFSTLSEDQIHDFENINFMTPDVSPEVGSRSMQRLIIAEDKVYNEGWIIVQPNRYRYAVIQSERVEVRMVFSEYLACQVAWEDAA